MFNKALPSIPGLSKVLFATAVLFPVVVGNVVALAISALLVGLALRSQGRLGNWNFTSDILGNTAHLSLVMFFGGLFLSAMPVPLRALVG